MSESLAIERRIDKEVTGGLTVGRTGELAFSNINEMMEVAKLMSLSEVAIPKHLRNNPGACLAVIVQASTWQMSPFAVANKSYSVNDRLAYESQMINAVILNRAPIKGRLKYEYTGEGPTLQCTVSAQLVDGGEVKYTSPMFRDIKVKNSPLWTQDPRMQMGYYASRAMCRQHFPDVILGVYTPEELPEADERDITPAKQTAQERLQARLAQNAQQEAQSAPEATETANASPSDDAPPFAEAEVVRDEDQSQEPQQPEVDEELVDFYLQVSDMTESRELDLARKEALTYDTPEKIELAKAAVSKKADSLGLEWHIKQGCFVTKG